MNRGKQEIIGTLCNRNNCGVSLSSKKTKGGMGLHLGIGLALSFSYILFQTIASTFAVNGNVPPVIAVWIPNILYAFIAFYLYQKAPK